MRDAALGGVPIAAYNGTFLITGQPAVNSFTYSTTGLAAGTAAAGAGTVTPAAGSVSVTSVAAVQAVAQDVGNPNLVRITTSNANGYAAGQQVLISGIVSPGGVVIAAYNGTFLIQDVDTATNSFRYVTAGLVAGTATAANQGTVTPLSQPTITMVSTGGGTRMDASGVLAPIYTDNNLAMDFDNGRPINDANTLMYGVPATGVTSTPGTQTITSIGNGTFNLERVAFALTTSRL